MNYIEKFYDILEEIAKEHNPEEDVYPDFEDLFENKILEELDLTEDEYNYAKNSFYANKNSFETYFNSCVEANIKNAQEIQETNNMLNRTFGIF